MRKLYVYLLLCLCIAATQAATATQNGQLLVKLKNAPVTELFKQIQEQSAWRFFYKDDLVADAGNITLFMHAGITDILDKGLQSTSLGYTISGNQVTIVPKAAMPPRQSKSNAAADDTLVLVKGRIYDTHEPPQGLPGVTVKLKDGNIGTTSDPDGYFSIRVPKNKLLVFSQIGYLPQEYSSGNGNNGLTIALKENISRLDEVVVTGLTEQQRKHIASSVATLNVASAMNGKPITTISQALQGGVTGLQVQQGSGLPGGDAATVKIRGISTLNSSNPLVLVDGVPMDMNHIDPLTIESVTVLKDAAAAASYGARAANGVIVITTRRGVPGKVSVMYDGYYGLQSPTFLPDLVDAPAYMRMYNEAQVNAGNQPFYSQDVIDSTITGADPVKYPNTDWQDLIINKAAPITSQSLGISGGNNMARFALNVNYQNQEGIIPLSRQRKYNIRANTSVSLSKKLTVNIDLLAIKRNQSQPNRLSGSNGNRILEDVYRVPPTILPKYPENQYGVDIYGRFVDIVNPLAYAEKGGIRKGEFGQSSINLQPRWEVMPNLFLRGQFSFRLNSDITQDTRDNYNFLDYNTGQLLQTWTQQRAFKLARTTYYYLAGSADYTLDRGDHHLFAMAGYSQEESNNGTQTSSSDVTSISIWSLLSAYAKVNYSYRDKFLLELTGRTDGSSKFGPQNKHGFFPSVAVGWNVSKEPFMQSIRAVSNMKLRASLGKLGNEGIDPYLYQNTINNSNGVETSNGNPIIGWETVNMLDIGLDLALFKGKLELVADYYDKRTTGMILFPQLSYTGGFEDDVPFNSGKVSNKGWEVSLNYNAQVNKNVNLSIRPGVTSNKNRITDMAGGTNITTTTIDEVGGPIGSWFGYKAAGLLQASDFDAAGNPLIPVVPGAKPGDIKYLDLNNNKIIDSEDQQRIGSNLPTLNYFANVHIGWKKLDLEFLLQGVNKSDAILQGMLALPLDMSKDGGVPTKYYLSNYWTPERTDARFPRLNAAPASNKYSSDFWFENGAYLRLKYIQLGYNYSSDALKRAGISRIRVYANAQNLWTLSSMTLMDPESQGNQWTYGVMKSFIAGLNVQF
ncbi:TonB-dependent receptor [Chitinophaga sp. sic0106]|uniref:SusC/RagA family TonB-linked outer membrane protein n=1 Tax=Chitinophaga sp. sic0106 TaxID=2854785 RepID=UPI001C48AFCF|nr:TonB-dependent receptor [Chitinophaga sp. sic0106]MBV7530570.1 TonB-dependent receptor [Chitinophaga sp. sic0106]